MTTTNKPRMEDLAGADHAPSVDVLTPEVRSGSSFTFSAAGSADDIRPAFLVVWIYTVKPDDRAAFHQKESAYVSSGTRPNPATTGISYRGTYAVTISGAAPDFEYRTFWGLSDLSKLKDLNDYLHDPQNQRPALGDMLKFIAPLPAMRAEIMGVVGTAKRIG